MGFSLFSLLLGRVSFTVYSRRLTSAASHLPQVLNSAWDAGIPVASENALPCYDRQGYNKILENAKPRKDPDGRCLAAFTYLRLNPTLMEEQNFKEFGRFVKRLHGELHLWHQSREGNESRSEGESKRESFLSIPEHSWWQCRSEPWSPSGRMLIHERLAGIPFEVCWLSTTENGKSCFCSVLSF